MERKKKNSRTTPTDSMNRKRGWAGEICKQIFRGGLISLSKLLTWLGRPVVQENEHLKADNYKTDGKKEGMISNKDTKKKHFYIFSAYLFF